MIRLLTLATLAALMMHAAPSKAQLTSSELFNQFQNRIGVMDSATDKLLAQRQAIRAGYDVQALEQPVDPATYHLGPGDGVYLNVFAAHVLDQDLTVTPEGKLIVPRIGLVDVAGLTVTQAEKKMSQLLAKDYNNPNASLSLRKLRPIKFSILGEVVDPGLQTGTCLQRVSEVIDKSGGFKKTSSLRNIEVRSPSGQLKARADLFRYYALGDVDANPMIESGDIIDVPAATHFVTVSGSVVSPGRIEFVPGDSLSTVLGLAMGLLPAALTDTIEIARFDASNPTREHPIFVRYAEGQNIPLQDGDVIFVRSLTQYHVPKLVSVSGEVQFPGNYTIIPGSTHLSDVLMRAGGVLPTGSLEEAVVIRRVGVGSWEADPEFNRLANLGMTKETMTEADYAYYLARYRQINRSVMVVDFKALLDGHDKSQDILLREQDSIYIPRAQGYVTVAGSVNGQGNVGYIEGGTYRDYIAKAGGFSSSADRSEIRIVNGKTGSHIDPTSDGNYRIQPGDMIIVPEQRSDFWKNFGTATAITAQVLTIVAGIFLLVKK